MQSQKRLPPVTGRGDRNRPAVQRPKPRRRSPQRRRPRRRRPLLSRRPRFRKVSPGPGRTNRRNRRLRLSRRRGVRTAKRIGKRGNRRRERRKRNGALKRRSRAKASGGPRRTWRSAAWFSLPIESRFPKALGRPEISLRPRSESLSPSRRHALPGVRRTPRAMKATSLRLAAKRRHPRKARPGRPCPKRRRIRTQTKRSQAQTRLTRERSGRKTPKAGPGTTPMLRPRRTAGLPLRRTPKPLQPRTEGLARRRPANLSPRRAPSSTQRRPRRSGARQNLPGKRRLRRPARAG